MRIADNMDGEPGEDETQDDEQHDGGKDTQATKLIKLATRSADFWHTPNGDAYATILVDEHHEHWPIKSKSFRLWVSRAYYLETKAAASAQATQDALGVLASQAIFDGDQRPVFVRSAEHEGKVYVDLCDVNWSAIEISGDGWQIVEKPPVVFRRAKAMLPLPMPVPGHVDDLRRFVNVVDADWPLVIAWLVAAMYPRGPYPLLSFAAEQGAGKSTTARVLRRLVDPNSAPLRSEPRDPRDLMIAANNGRIVALDNLSRLPDWLSDALCRLSTGGGFSTRELRSDQDEIIFDAMRPAILTGIEDVINRGDLLDRSLVIGLPVIPENQRRPETEFWNDFEVAQPAIFGGLLTALSGAIRNLPSTRLANLPRMADFAVLATAAEPALGLAAGMFMLAYGGNRQDANTLAIESDPIAKFLIELVAKEPWQGTASDLLRDLDAAAGDQVRRGKDWPKNPKAVAGMVKRLAPSLRRLGIEVEDYREPTIRRRRIIAFRTRGQCCVQSVQSVQPPEKPGVPVDALDADGPLLDAALDAGNPQIPGTQDALDALDAKKQAYSAVANDDFPAWENCQPWGST